MERERVHQRFKFQVHCLLALLQVGSEPLLVTVWVRFHCGPIYRREVIGRVEDSASMISSLGNIFRGVGEKMRQRLRP